jgi:hypothetical protein
MLMCQRCKSLRVATVNAKCSDQFDMNIEGHNHYGYVPSDFGIRGGDYINFTYCLDCGQMNGTWPLPQTMIEEEISENLETTNEAE